MIDAEKVLEKLHGKTKDQLQKLAREQFGKSVEVTDTLDVIKKAVVALYVEKDNLIFKEKEAGKTGEMPKFYKNPKTNNIFTATLELYKQKNLVPCDKDGNEIRG